MEEIECLVSEKFMNEENILQRIHNVEMIATINKERLVEQDKRILRHRAEFEKDMSRINECLNKMMLLHQDRDKWESKYGTIVLNNDDYIGRQKRTLFRYLDKVVIYVAAMLVAYISWKIGMKP